MYYSNDFRTAEISSLFIKKDTLEVSYIKMGPPSEFESLSTRESIAFVHFLGVIWVENFTDLTQLVSIFILILLG